MQEFDERREGGFFPTSPYATPGLRLFHPIKPKPIAAATTTTLNPLIPSTGSDADDCTSPQHFRVYVTLLC